MRLIGRILAVIGALTLTFALVGGIAVLVTVRRGFSARDEPSSIEAFIARTLRRMSVPARWKGLKNPVPPTPEVLAEARAHWADHCALCHANDGSGKTPMGQSLYPLAPDMRASPTQELSDGELYAIIQNGIRLTGMPAWGEASDQEDEESWGLVAFIRHLPRVSEEELREMEQLNPRSAHEVQEEKEDEQFLEGDEPPTQGATQ
jgi:mono/diheme cytochrome c family protein